MLLGVLLVHLGLGAVLTLQQHQQQQKQSNNISCWLPGTAWHCGSAAGVQLDAVRTLGSVCDTSGWFSVM
jgi:hypothetical protein